MPNCTVVERWKTKNIGALADFLRLRNVIYTSILHGYGDIKPERFRDYDLELLGSCDVIGHVTIGLAKCDFLYEVNCNHTSIVQGYGDIELQVY